MGQGMKLSIRVAARIHVLDATVTTCCVTPIGAISSQEASMQTLYSVAGYSHQMDILTNKRPRKLFTRDCDDSGIGRTVTVKQAHGSKGTRKVVVARQSFDSTTEAAWQKAQAL